MRIVFRGGAMCFGPPWCMEIADLLIEGDRISAIGEVRPLPSDHVIPATGLWILPGLINAHLHSHDLFLRSRYEGLPLESLALFLNPSIHAPLSPRAIYIRTLVVAIEMLRAGFTSCIDTIALHPLTSEHLVAAMRAYQDAGMRAWVGARLIDVSSLEPDLMARLPESAREPLIDQNALAADAAVQLLREALPFGDRRVRVAPMPSSPHRCTDEFLQAMDEFSRQHVLPWQTHVLETAAQFHAARRFSEQSTIAHLHALGVLSPRCGIVHAVWATRRELEVIGATGAIVLHNPVCNLRFGAGIASLAAMRAAKVAVALGTDNACSGRCDPFETMRVAALLSQVTDRRLHSPTHFAFSAMTNGGARACIESNDLGVFRVGALADLVVINPWAVWLTPGADPIQHLVYHLTPASVRYVMVDGRIVVEDGRVTSVNEDAIAEEALELARRVACDHRQVASRGDEVLKLLSTSADRQSP